MRTTIIVVCAMLAFLTIYFALQKKKSSSELAEIIKPIPQITETTYLPSPKDMQVVLNTLKVAGIGSSTAKDLDNDIKDYKKIQSKSKYWMVKTKLTPNACHDFYADETNRQGWKIVKDNGELGFILEKDGLELIIFTTSDWAGTDILYDLEPKGE